MTESLEQQTATAEILRVISSSPTDLQPVMDVVARKCRPSLRCDRCRIWRLEGEFLRLVAHTWADDRATADRRDHPLRAARSVSGRAVRDEQVDPLSRTCWLYPRLSSPRRWPGREPAVLPFGRSWPRR